MIVIDYLYLNTKYWSFYYEVQAKKGRYNPDTIEDLSLSHFVTPRKAKKKLEMVKCKFDQKRTQNVNLKKQVNRLQVKLRTYNDLILQLKYKIFLSENSPVHLQV